MNKTLLKVLAMLSLAGCANLAPPQEEGGEEIGADTAELTRSPKTTAPSWLMRVRLDGLDRSCSASMLSRHWLLTAAHCVKGRSTDTVHVSYSQPPNATRHVYDGPAHIWANPSWSPSTILGQVTNPDSGDDIGLIHIDGEPGQMQGVGQAKLYMDTREPWEGNRPEAERSFVVVGYGKGTDPGGSDDCDDGTSGQKRIGGGFKVDTNNPSTKLTASYGSIMICPGDSGGAWLFQRGTPNGEDEYMQIGITSAREPQLPVVSDEMFAAMVKPRIGFIESTSSATTHPLTCGWFARNGWYYRRCDEPRVLAPIDSVVLDVVR